MKLTLLRKERAYEAHSSLSPKKEEERKRNLGPFVGRVLLCYLGGLVFGLPVPLGDSCLFSH